MSDISKLAVILTADAGGFANGFKGAGAHVDALKEKTHSLGGEISNVTSLLAGLGVAFSAAAAFEAFKADEQSIAKLDAVIRSTGDAAGFSRGELQHYAEQLQDVTTFSHETTVSAEAVLATFTQIRGDQFKDAIVAAQNLSTILGQDLQQSAIQVGKALNDPANGIKALRKAGVSFTSDQLAMIASLQASGDLMGAQKVILKELETEFGGAAEAVGGTFSGQLTQAKNAIGDVAQFVIGMLTPGMKAFTDGIKDSVEWVKRHADGIQILSRWVLDAVAAVAIYKGALLALAIAQRAAAVAQGILTALSGPAGWVKLAGAAIAATVAITAVNSAFDSAAEAATYSEATGTGAANAIQASMSDAGDAVDGLGDKIEGAASKTKKAGESISDILTKVAQEYRDLSDQLDHGGTAAPKDAKFWKDAKEHAESIAKRLDEVRKAGQAATEKRAALTGTHFAEGFTESSKKQLFDMIDPGDKASRAAINSLPSVEDARRALALLDAQAATYDDTIKKLSAELRELETSAGQVERSKQMHEEIEALQQQTAEMDKLKKKAKELYEQSKSPAEKYEDTMKELEDMQKRGALDEASRAKIAEHITAEYVKQMETRDRHRQRPDYEKNFAGEKVGALERRFTAGFPADDKNERDKTRKIHERTANATERSAKATEETAKNTAAQPDTVDF